MAPACRCCQDPRPAATTRSTRLGATACPCWPRTTAPVDDLLPATPRTDLQPRCCSMVSIWASPGAARGPSAGPQAGGNAPVLMGGESLPRPDEGEFGETVPHCPRCAAPLVAQEARVPMPVACSSACSRFPECHYTPLPRRA